MTFRDIPQEILVESILPFVGDPLERATLRCLGGLGWAQPVCLHRPDIERILRHRTWEADTGKFVYLKLPVVRRDGVKTSIEFWMVPSYFTQADVDAYNIDIVYYDHEAGPVQIRDDRHLYFVYGPYEGHPRPNVQYQGYDVYSDFYTGVLRRYSYFDYGDGFHGVRLTTQM
jgi:hypothetical protein